MKWRMRVLDIGFGRYIRHLTDPDPVRCYGSGMSSMFVLNMTVL
jgi:hypothetical protein